MRNETRKGRGEDQRELAMAAIAVSAPGSERHGRYWIGEDHFC